jgi:hypothetical protein
VVAEVGKRKCLALLVDTVRIVLVVGGSICLEEEIWRDEEDIVACAYGGGGSGSVVCRIAPLVADWGMRL